MTAAMSAQMLAASATSQPMMGMIANHAENPGRVGEAKRAHQLGEIAFGVGSRQHFCPDHPDDERTNHPTDKAGHDRAEKQSHAEIEHDQRTGHRHHENHDRRL